MDNKVLLDAWNYIEKEYTIPQFGKAVGGACAASALKFTPILGGAVGAFGKIGSLFEKKEKEMPDDLFKNECALFYKKLCQYCDMKNISESDLYNSAKISRQIFSNIRSMGKKPYTPSKITVVCICIALQLKLEEAQEMLAILGFTLSDKIITDKVVSYCLQNELGYSVDAINDVIYERTNGQHCLIKVA